MPRDDGSAVTRLMSDNAVRRLPFVEDGQPVRFVSLGDVAEIGEGTVDAGRHLRIAGQVLTLGHAAVATQCAANARGLR